MCSVENYKIRNQNIVWDRIRTHKIWNCWYEHRALARMANKPYLIYIINLDLKNKSIHTVFKYSESRTHDLLGTYLAFAKLVTFKVLHVEAIFLYIYKQNFARLTA